MSKRICAAGCGDPISGDESCIGYGGRDYHLECISFPAPVIHPRSAAERREIRTKIQQAKEEDSK